jgi:hypothetical protein
VPAIVNFRSRSGVADSPFSCITPVADTMVHLVHFYVHKWCPPPEADFFSGAWLAQKGETSFAAGMRDEG